MLPGATFFFFLITRDLLGSYIKKVGKGSFLLLPICFTSFIFAMGIVEERLEWTVSHSFAQF